MVSLQQTDHNILQLLDPAADEHDLAQIAIIQQLPTFALAHLQQIAHVSVLVVILHQIVAPLAGLQFVGALVLHCPHVVETQHHTLLPREFGQFAHEEAEVYRSLLVAVTQSANYFKLAVDKFGLVSQT